MIRTGKYDQRISFVEFGQVSNGSGGYIPAETVLLSTNARIEQLKQSRNIEQVQMGLPSTYRVGVMVRKGFEPKVGMTVKWRDERYQIITSPVVANVRMMREWVFDITRSNG